MNAVPSVATLYTKGCFLLVVVVVSGVLQGCSSAENEGGSPSKRGEFRISASTTRRLQSTSLSSLTSNFKPNHHKCTLQQRLEVGFRTTGNYTRTETARDALYCATVCQYDLEGCRAINYDTSTQTCYFLEKHDFVIADSGYTTALIRPAVSDLCSTRNFLWYMDSKGTVMAGSPFTADDGKDCCRNCMSTAKCISYVYNTERSTCWLKSAIDEFVQSNDTLVGLICPKTD